MRLIFTMLFAVAAIASSAQDAQVIARSGWFTGIKNTDSTNFASQNGRIWYGANGLRFTEGLTKYSLKSYIATFAPAVLGTAFWKLAGTSTATGSMSIVAGNNDFSLSGNSENTNMLTNFYTRSDSSGIFAYNPLASNSYYTKLLIQNNSMSIESREINESAGMQMQSNNATLFSNTATTSTTLTVTPNSVSMDTSEPTFIGAAYGSNIRANFTGLSLVDMDYVIATAKTYSEKQTLAGSTTVAGANFANSATMSSGLADGDFRYNSTSDIWFGRTNGSILPFAQGPASSTAFGVPYFSNTTGALLGSTGVGSSGQVLTSNGAGVAPTFQTVSGGGTINGSIANVSTNERQLAFSNGSNTIAGVNGATYTTTTGMFKTTVTANVEAILTPTLLQFYDATGTTYQGNYTRDGITASNAAAEFDIVSSNGSVKVETVTFNDTGINGNSTGMKHKRITETIPGSSEEDVTITWTTPFANNSYTTAITIVATDAGSSQNGPVSGIIIDQTASAVVFRVTNQSTNDFPAQLMAIAIHD